MTALDAGVVLFLALLAAGGYRQGLLRGLLRLTALGAIGATAALLALGLARGGALEDVLLRAGLLFGGVVVLVATAAWLLGRALPPATEGAALNRWLGVVPALLAGVVVLALALGLTQRIAFGDALEGYVAGGLLTGPLARPVQWLERAALAPH